MANLRAAYLNAADAALHSLARDEVVAAWDRPSALTEWTVGGLGGHLAGQIFSVVELLDQPPCELAPITVDEHYARAAWVAAGVDEEVNVGIRAGGNQAAADGPLDLLARARAGRDAAAELLGGQPADRVVWVPWQGWALRLDDFLTTRMMEIAVHADDLAFSVNVDAPPLGREVLDPVLALLIRLAMRRHGQGALLRALTRRERAPESVSAF